jgi:hypothetical protein
MARSPAALFELSRVALGTTQVGLGKMFGVARRTAQRWSDTGVPFYYLPKLAALVYARDPLLAAEIAASAGKTLEGLGIVKPSPPMAPPVDTPPAPQAPPSPAPPPPLPAGVAEAVVCACAEAMDLSPRAVRQGLHAAFATAAQLGLDVQTVERWLRKPAAPAAGDMP